MSAVVLPLLYLRWHYTRAVRDLLGIWSNFFWFVGNLFSVGILFRTLLQPLKLMSEDKGSLLADPVVYAENLLVNLIMRIVGGITRLTLIVIALCAWSVLLVGGVTLFFLWLALPLLLVGTFGTGMTLLL